MICTSATSYKRKRWQLPDAPPDPAAVEHLANALRLPPLIAQLLIQRGLADPAAALAFLEPKFKDLHSPYLLPNMHAAADRIVAAVRNHEKITLYGDYDVDGITGTAMLWHTLKAAGANVDTYIPHRVDEGYGLNTDAIKSLADAGTQLLITIDCGCSAIDPITYARSRNLDVIVSDHHEFPANGELPPANAIVHPRLPLSTPYPNPDLCGAGVAFKLAWAIAQKLCNTERVNDTYRALLMEFTALAALGTIADVVPLIGENRIIVKHGLDQLARTQLPGLRALIHAAGYGRDSDGGGRTLDCTAVGFALAPRLNAAGRMDHAREAVELLTTATGQRAEELAAWLEEQNRERQSTERKMADLAKEQIGDRQSAIGNDLDLILVAAHDSFHAGVVGIVASRLVDAFHRPAFVLAQSPTELHGSARSIPGFDLHLAIDHVRDLLLSGGGHAMAGGVKLALHHLDEFRQRLNDYARLHLSEDDLIPTLPIDAVITLADCTPAVISHLERLEPFGRGNPRPRFLLENLRLSAPPRRVGVTGNHLQLTLSSPPPAPRLARAIAFKMGDLEPQLPIGTHLHLIVEPKLDTFNHITKVDLIILDLARCDNEPFTSP
ncbi:MAG TPA: single-stranded-DNA-specific exonuclease RecJ [Phycisphaerae bacterium]|nr:single-stranded-DNA-specific exonuclease RecJ [Phycisphaerae bacterium]